MSYGLYSTKLFALTTCVTLYFDSLKVNAVVTPMQFKGLMYTYMYSATYALRDIGKSKAVFCVSYDIRFACITPFVTAWNLM